MPALAVSYWEGEKGGDAPAAPAPTTNTFFLRGWAIMQRWDLALPLDGFYAFRGLEGPDDAIAVDAQSFGIPDRRSHA